MADEGATKDPGGQQPDFKKGWEAAAEAGGMKPKSQSETATSTTMPETASESVGQAKAAEILKDAAEKDIGSPSRLNSYMIE